MEKEKLEGKIPEVIRLASETPEKERWERIRKIISQMDLETLNELDRKIVLTKRDFEPEETPTLVLPTVIKINIKKFDLIVEEVLRRGGGNFEFFSKMPQLIRRCFFRHGILENKKILQRFAERIKEVAENPEISLKTKLALYRISELVFEECYRRLAYQQKKIYQAKD